MAITFNEALSAARKLIPEIDNYIEERDAWIFGISSNTNIGGEGSPVVVLKETGQCVGMPIYISMGYPAEVVSEGRIPS